MKSGKDFLKRLDESKFEKAIDLIKKESIDPKSLVETTEFVENYKKKDLLEYLDKNKDKELSLSAYEEGQPVFVGDEYAPHARKQGKVISKGEADGTIKVKFDDGEYDIPSHHLTRQDAVANESVEDYYFAITESGKLLKIRLMGEDLDEIDVEKQLEEKTLAIFPQNVSTSFIAEEMTDEQIDKKEKIVMALKKNSRQLKKRYGDKWESVMYAIATKKAIGEKIEESSGDVIYKQKTHYGFIEIVNMGEEFAIMKTNASGKEEVARFNKLVDAERYVQSGV